MLNKPYNPKQYANQYATNLFALGNKIFKIYLPFNPF